jgi:cell division protein ZapA
MAMQQVTVTINGSKYRMACEDGQENHLMELARSYDQRIGELRGKFGEIGDARLMVMAAMTVADELSESSRKLRALEEELAAYRNERAASAGQAQATQAAIADAFNSAAERIETIARKLHRSRSDEAAIG